MKKTVGKSQYEHNKWGSVSVEKYTWAFKLQRIHRKRVLPQTKTILYCKAHKISWMIVSHMFILISRRDSNDPAAVANQHNYEFIWPDLTGLLHEIRVIRVLLQRVITYWYTWNYCLDAEKCKSTVWNKMILLGW